MLMVRDLGQAVYTSINWCVCVCACVFVFGDQHKQFLIDKVVSDESSIRESLFWEQIAILKPTQTWDTYSAQTSLPKLKEDWMYVHYRYKIRVR